MIGPENDHFRLLAGERKYPFGALAEPLERIDVWGAKANLQGLVGLFPSHSLWTVMGPKCR